MHTKHDCTRGPEPLPAEQRLIDKHQLARALGVTPRTIDNWVRHRLIPSIPISARCRRFQLGSVIAAVRRYETGVADRTGTATPTDAAHPTQP